MISINEAKRLVKRALLANLTTKKRDLAITPLVSGKHGIGKSQMVKSIARELGGACITIEGGTLKEGEITGLPYQYKDEAGQIRFRFCPIMPWSASRQRKSGYLNNLVKKRGASFSLAMKTAMRKTIFPRQRKSLRCRTVQCAP